MSLSEIPAQKSLLKDGFKKLVSQLKITLRLLKAERHLFFGLDFLL